MTDLKHKDPVATHGSRSDGGKSGTEYQSVSVTRRQTRLTGNRGKQGNQSTPKHTVKTHEKGHNINDDTEVLSPRKRKKTDLKVKISRVQSLSTEKKCRDSKTCTSKPVTHECKKCDAKFKTKIAMNLHKYKIHKEAADTMCINCGRQFELKHDVEIHRNFMCKKLKRRFECNACLLRFTTSKEKSKHFCTKDPEKPFYCPQENCTFKAKKFTALSEHVSRHLGIKQFLCVTCGNAFAAKKDLDRHMDVHKPSKDCVCQYCGCSYKCPHALRAHLRKHKNKGRYKCEHCSFTSALYDGYKQHQLTHKARAYKCGICGKCLRSERSLNQHIKGIHTLEQIFACKYCDFTTKVGQSYASHTKKHRNKRDKSESEKESSDTEQPLTDLSSTSSLLSPTTYFSISNVQQSVTQTPQLPRSQGNILPSGSPNQPMLGDPSLHYDGEVNISGQDADTLMANIVSSAEGQDISMITPDAAGTSLNLYSTEAVSNCPSSMALPSLILSESVATASTEESVTVIDRKL